MARCTQTATRIKDSSTRDLQHEPQPFSTKEVLNSNLGKMFLSDSGPPSSQSAGFPNKVPIPCSDSSYLLIDWLTMQPEAVKGNVNSRKHQKWHKGP